MKLTKEQLVQHIQTAWKARIQDLARFFGVTSMTIHRHLVDLCANGLIHKQWSWPQTLYQATILSSTKDIYTHIPLPLRTALDTYRYQINKVWQVLEWVAWFVSWCTERGFDIHTQAQQRYTYVTEIEKFRDDSWCLYASQKLHTYGADVLHRLWYQDLYAWPQYGKTKWWTFLEIAKIHPTLRLFGTIIAHIRPTLEHLIALQHIDAVCFVKPTMQRKLQIMSYLEKNLSLWLPIIPLQKVPGFFPPQKSLAKREDRIANAQASFFIPLYPNTYQHVLLIDDAVGSGATLIEIAKKIQNLGIAKTVSWYAITGTANGILSAVQKFEVFANT